MKNILVIGTGTIGEPLIGLLADFKKKLEIDVYFNKRTPLLDEVAKVESLIKRGAKLVTSPVRKNKFKKLGHEVTCTYEEALEKASGKQTESAKFYEIQKEFGKGEAIAHQQKDNPNFWGSYSKMDKKELKKLPDSAIGMIIYDETENSFYTISVDDEGEKEKKFLSRA